MSVIDFVSDAERLKSRDSYRSSVEEKADSLRAELSRSEQAVRSQLEEVQATKPQLDQSLDQIIQKGNSEINAIADQVVAAVERATDSLFRARSAIREVQYDLQIERAPYIYSIVDVLAVMLAFILLEGGGSGLLFVADGKMGYAEGLGYGFTFATSLFLIGLFVGFLPLRYSFYRSTALEPEPIDKLIRFVARVGTAVGSLILLVLVAATFRTRALGTHNGIFNFNEVGLWEGFNDSIAILIAAISFCGAIFSVYKGFTAFDPIPGYGALGRKARIAPLRAAESAEEEGIDAIEELVEELSDEFQKRSRQAQQQAKAYNENIRRAVNGVTKHNRQIETNSRKVLRFAEKKERRRRFITKGVSLDEPVAVVVKSITDDFSDFFIHGYTETQTLLVSEHEFSQAELKVEMMACAAKAQARVREAFAMFEVALDDVTNEETDGF